MLILARGSLARMVIRASFACVSGLIALSAIAGCSSTDAACDGDAILLRVRPAGPACHTGSESCFAPWLWRTVAERARERPPGSYVAALLDEGPAAAARKVGEEGVEAALAGAA